MDLTHNVILNSFQDLTEDKQTPNGSMPDAETTKTKNTTRNKKKNEKNEKECEHLY
jgi:hypothetical protein